MSYDLMVFASEAAPKVREALMEWYDEQSKCGEDHSYDNPMCQRLRSVHGLWR